MNWILNTGVWIKTKIFKTMDFSRNVQCFLVTLCSLVFVYVAIVYDNSTNASINQNYHSCCFDSWDTFTGLWADISYICTLVFNVAKINKCSQIFIQHTHSLPTRQTKTQLQFHTYQWIFFSIHKSRSFHHTFGSSENNKRHAQPTTTKCTNNNKCTNK